MFVAGMIASIRAKKPHVYRVIILKPTVSGNVQGKSVEKMWERGCVSVEKIACEQALLFGRAKLASRGRRSLARSRETRFARRNRRACSQAMEKTVENATHLRRRNRKKEPNHGLKTARTAKIQLNER